MLSFKIISTQNFGGLAPSFFYSQCLEVQRYPDYWSFDENSPALLKGSPDLRFIPGLLEFHTVVAWHWALRKLLQADFCSEVLRNVLVLYF